ncbi:MAG: rhodanese-like domain-containing protein [SAR202 cluster bacterium]|nr:rhodanese-like domain-containing protein [Dehalococcoidia bacterium]MDP7588148.1 rhodanese-like domain-containing protein [Dehalococcoidia bacterium]MQF87779.1 rhodanese-like domain-containing protein [SAR202 cluster bacterium]MQG10741.1 rhodanese-like domain-containing protein [SAR202 cluster bacterium]MQG54543.1 rhodanese-like domain-containing protein [SAR202 cluster bacterium]
MGAQILQEMGFNNVTYMEGGMVAWNEAGFPTKE